MKLVISEGIESTWHYHYSQKNAPAIALCGARTMLTKIPQRAWGTRSHLNEHWCQTCASVSAECEIAGGSGNDS